MTNEQSEMDTGSNPMSYARSRLLLGVSAVGTVVFLASALLLFRQALPAPGDLNDHTLLVLFFVSVAVIHVPFDVLGGYLLPKSAGRQPLSAGAFALALLRGFSAHTAVLLLIAELMLLSTGFLGRLGFIIAAVVTLPTLLVARWSIARVVGGLGPQQSGSDGDIKLVASSDEGFTGGIMGALRPGPILTPMHWTSSMTPSAVRSVIERRRIAASSGSWLRGRVTALAFTLSGVSVSALVVPASTVGTATGVVIFSLCFTIWSFLGLLTLPTLSRAAAIKLDAAARVAGTTATDLKEALSGLDRMQDDEPARSRWVERIFHPIPSVESRGSRIGSVDASHKPPGAWDVARTSIYLSWAGLGLLSRSVHCNCGRPALWVFLPTE